MPAMTKFSVWEPEARAFIIDAVAEIRLKTPLVAQVPREETINQVTEWLYSKGIEVFSTAQAAEHIKFVSDHEKTHGKKPEITTERIIENKKVGFAALWLSFAENFAKYNEELMVLLRDEFETFKLRGLAHERFFSLQALITTQMYAAINANPSLDTPAFKLEFTKNAFSEAKQTHPDLIQTIDDQLLLQREFVVYMTEKKRIVDVTTSVGSGSTLFGATLARQVADRLREIDAPRPVDQPGMRLG